VYVLVEHEPDTGQTQILFPRESIAQVHTSLEAAREHRDWYIRVLFGGDQETARERIVIYRLDPV
jgi:hypothetical protein